MEKIKKALKEMEAAFLNYNNALNYLAALLVTKVDFEFTIQDQPADGFVIVDRDTNNAPLDICLEIIRKKGKLSVEDYLDNRI